MSIFGDILPLNKNEDKKGPGASFSPYLNFDPNYIPKMQSDYIYPDDSHMATTARRSNVALPIIGMSFMTGSGKINIFHQMILCHNLKVTISLSLCNGHNIMN